MKCKCGDEMTIDNYYTRNQCKKCRREYMRAYRANNVQKLNAYQREYIRIKRRMNLPVDGDMYRPHGHADNIIAMQVHGGRARQYVYKKQIA